MSTDKTVACLGKTGITTDCHITVKVALQIVVKRDPRPEITPSEIRRKHKYLIGTLHNCIIYRYVAAFRETLIYTLLLFGSEEIRSKRLEYRCYGRLVHTESIHDSRHVPDENARIPIKVFLCDIRLGHLQRRLFLERIDTEHLLIRQR